LRNGVVVLIALLSWQILPVHSRWYGAALLTPTSGQASRGYQATIGVPSTITWAGPSFDTGTVPLNRRSRISNSIGTLASANGTWFQIGWRIARGETNATSYIEWFDVGGNRTLTTWTQVAPGNSQNYKTEYIGTQWCGFVNGFQAQCGSASVPKASLGIIQGEIHINPHIAFSVDYSNIRFIKDDPSGTLIIPTTSDQSYFPYSVNLSSGAATVSGPDANANRVSVPIGPQ
jgi:hypothetical protein